MRNDVNYSCLFLKDKKGNTTNPSKYMLNRAIIIGNKYENTELLR